MPIIHFSGGPHDGKIIDSENGSMQDQQLAWLVGRCNIGDEQTFPSDYAMQMPAKFIEGAGFVPASGQAPPQIPVYRLESKEVVDGHERMIFAFTRHKERFSDP